jgi:putative methyltransferase (TIGR04325 family)
MRQLLAAIARRLRPPTEVLQGYEQPELVEVVFKKTLAYIPDRAWPEIAGASSVLDFGGGCGLHYKQAKSPDVRWAVVDTPMMVARAAALATDKLKFFAGIAAAADWLGDVDVMHSNGALQYTPNPKQTLRELCGLGARRMIWNRMALSEDITETEIQSALLSDNGPGRISLLQEKTVRYALIKIAERDFLNAHARYNLVARGEDWFRFALN